MVESRPKIEQRVLRQLAMLSLMLIVALIETSFAPTLWRFRANWVLLIVVGWTLLRGFGPGLNLAIYGGLALDLLGVLPVGSHLLALLLCVLAVAVLAEPLDREQPLLMIAALLGAALLYGATLALVLRFTGNELPWMTYLLVAAVPTALVDTISAVPTFALLRRLHRQGQPRVATEFS
jgi:rod shape-determining protein MreD